MTDVVAPADSIRQHQSDPIEPIELGATVTPKAPHTGRTRISAAWVGVMTGALVLVLLVVFILQNTRTIKVSYFGLAGSMPLGIALLLATIAGLFLAGGIASLRIWQLRRRLTRQIQPAPHITVSERSRSEV